MYSSLVYLQSKLEQALNLNKDHIPHAELYGLAMLQGFIFQLASFPEADFTTDTAHASDIWFIHSEPPDLYPHYRLQSIHLHTLYSMHQRLNIVGGSFQ
jgi:hypothetical protein